MIDLARRLIDVSLKTNSKIVTSESCTGGLIAACLTEISGSSQVFDRSFIAYSNEAKTEMLGVPSKVLTRHGAVSEQVAMAMASGALARSHATISIAVTGIAGPRGGSLNKPVGLVHIYYVDRSLNTAHLEKVICGNRQAVRMETVHLALNLCHEQISIN